MPEVLEWEHFHKTVAEYLGVELSEVKRDTNIYNDLGIDSLGMFSLGMNLIKVYQIKLPLSVIPTIATVGDIFDAMSKHAVRTL